MKRAVSLWIFVVLTCLLLSVSGCKEEPAAKEQAKQTLAKTETAADAKELGDIKIGVSMYTLGAPYFVAQFETLKSEAERLGLGFAGTNARDDMMVQLSQVEDLLAQGIDLLIFNPKDPQGSIPATKMATEAGVPVIVIDSSIDTKADFVTTVQSNNRANGILIGEWLVKQMDGEPIKMALLSGVPGNPVGFTRRNGVFTGIIEGLLRTKNRTDWEIVTQGWGDWYQEGGLQAMEDIIVAHPEINVMLAENDSMALGAIKAIKEAGREDDILVLACADGQKEALALIKEGKYGATGMNNPGFIAKTAIDIGIRYLKGERGFPQKSYTTAVCLTKENVDEYYDPEAIF
ncbi:MAG: substrate-binding domain-containing protein [Planctomycetota bacterium]